MLSESSDLSVSPKAFATDIIDFVVSKVRPVIEQAAQKKWGANWATLSAPVNVSGRSRHGLTDDPMQVFKWIEANWIACLKGVIDNDLEKKQLRGQFEALLNERHRSVHPEKPYSETDLETAYLCGRRILQAVDPQAVAEYENSYRSFRDQGPNNTEGSKGADAADVSHAWPSEFWQSVAKQFIQVIKCPECTKWAGDLGLPNPGWVGPKYEPHRGVVILLQNPAVTTAAYPESRDRPLQEGIARLAKEQSCESFRNDVHLHIDDMLGHGGTLPSWVQWTQTVGEVIGTRLRANEIAWINVANHRTPNNNPLTDEQVNHGFSHLRSSLLLLQPFAVVTVGSVAQKQFQRLADLGEFTNDPHCVSVKQRGASADEIASASTKLRLALDKRDGVESSLDRVDAKRPAITSPVEDPKNLVTQQLIRSGKLLIKTINGAPDDFHDFLSQYEPYEAFENFEAMYQRYRVYQASHVAYKDRQLPTGVAMLARSGSDAYLDELPQWAVSLKISVAGMKWVSVFAAGVAAFGTGSRFDRRGGRKPYDMLLSR